MKILSVNFPFIDNPNKFKKRPVVCLTKPLGKHKIIVIAYITSKVEHIEETDILIDKNKRYFSDVGIKFTSLIRLSKVTSIHLNSIEKEIGILPKELENQMKYILKKMFNIK